MVLDVMTGNWAGDLYGLPATRPFVEGLLDRPQPLRVLMWTDSGLAPPDPEALHAVQTARDLLHQLGHAVVEADNPVPWTSALQDALLVLFTAAVAVAARPIAGDTRDLLAPYTRWSLEEAERHSAVDFAAAQAVVATAAARQLAAAAVYDVVLTPTAAGPAAPGGGFEQDGTGEECGRRMLEWSAYTPWANLTGQPALSLPLHVTDSGLPVGAHLVGARVGDDHLLLRLAAQLEWAAPFAHRHPPQW
jgi:amidase